MFIDIHVNFINRHVWSINSWWRRCATAPWTLQKRHVSQSRQSDGAGAGLDRLCLLPEDYTGGAWQQSVGPIISLAVKPLDPALTINGFCREPYRRQESWNAFGDLGFCKAEAPPVFLSLVMSA